MEWTDLVIETRQSDAQAAADIAVLYSGGGIQIEDYRDMEKQVWEIAHVDLIEEELLEKSRELVRIHLYISPDENAGIIENKLTETLQKSGIKYRLIAGAVEQEDWETAWKRYYHTIEIGNKIAIVPSWEEYEGQRVALRLDPGMAFGTGTHETTFLCLELLEEGVAGGERVLDIGTGSGILAIAALLLGAGEALGVDIDPMCVRVAGENAGRNGVEERFTLAAGDLAGKASGKYDIITANIVADAIIRLAPEAARRLAQKGRFIASGILEERCEEVADVLRQNGLQVLEIKRANGWVALLAAHGSNN